MGFLKRLFGGDKKDKPYVDTRGVYFYVRCNNCPTCVRMRADKEYDLMREGDGYTWHKTIVDNRCFRQIPTVAHLNSNYEIDHAEIEGGEYITEEEYNAWLNRPKEPPEPEETEASEASDQFCL